MKRLFLLCVVLLVFLPLTGLPAWGASPAGEALASAKQAYHQLLDSQRRQLYRDNWEKVIDRFLAIPGAYPGATDGAGALYLAGKASQGLYRVSRVEKDARRAVEIYLRVPEEFPGNTLGDDALVLAAGIEEKTLGEPASAWRHYRQALDRYPNGDMGTLAVRRLKALARYAPEPVAASPAAPAVVEAEAPSQTPRQPGRGQLTEVRFWSNPGYTRVVLDLDRPADFSANLLPGDPRQGQPPRLYVDIAQTLPAAGLPDSTRVGDGLLQQIRTGRPRPATTRVVLDLVSFGDYKVFPLPDPYRIVIDVAGEGGAQLKSDRPELSALPPDGISRILDEAPVEPPLKVQVPTSHAEGLRRIVVDAGHGGKDPGALGPGGTREKDVTLAMARILARRLKKELGCEVVLTRDSDVFLPLEERTAIANKVGADLFISLHANASRKRSVHGVETYYLNFSKNNQAVAVAARENGTSLKQVGDLEMILLDLMANSKINESSRLAAEIQRSLVAGLDRHYRSIRDLGVRQGPFYVLLGATMPSVLVETAFISNPREEKRLGDAHFRSRAAEGIVRGVKNYAIALKMLAAQ